MPERDEMVQAACEQIPVPIRCSEVAALPESHLGFSRRHLRFGPFELRTHTRELSRLGTRVKLQAKPARILEMLLAQPGELVRREELCAQLWPGDVFVDFESGLNTAVNRLRTALGDTAETPLYIETIPRLGYRFICPVQDISQAPPESGSSDCAGRYDGGVFAHIDPSLDRFVNRMFLRLALAVLLAFASQFLFFGSDLSHRILQACFLE